MFSIFCVCAKYITMSRRKNAILIIDLVHVLFLCTRSYLSSTVIDQLHRPAALILDPNKDPSVCITGGQFLEGLIPPHQDHLKGTKTMIKETVLNKSRLDCVQYNTDLVITETFMWQLWSFTHNR